MRAVIVIDQECKDLHLLKERYPFSCMLPVMDIPFLQHIIEYLRDKGIEKFDFLLPHSMLHIREFFGKGTQWGATFSYLEITSNDYPYRALHAIDDDILLVDSNCLAAISMSICEAIIKKKNVVCYYHHGTERWNGWMGVSRHLVCEIADIPRFGLENYAKQGFFFQIPANTLSIKSSSEFLYGCWGLLSYNLWKLKWGVKELEPKIWIGRGAKIHPTVKIIPPVYIGEDVVIEEDVIIGHNAIISKGCVIDKKSVLNNCVVLAGSYVSEFVETRNAIVDKDYSVNVNMHAGMKMTDNFVLEESSSVSLKSLNI